MCGSCGGCDRNKKVVLKSSDHEVFPSGCGREELSVIQSEEICTQTITSDSSVSLQGSTIAEYPLTSLTARPVLGHRTGSMSLSS